MDKIRGWGYRLRNQDSEIGPGIKGRGPGRRPGKEIKEESIGPVSEPVSTESISTDSTGKKILTMADAVPGKKYRITGIHGGCKLNSRLCAMGFVPGEVFHVSGASAGGPVCVVIKGTKFAIGRGMAERIQVVEEK
ncbi:MAG: FeoA family protein [Actinomycetota bacterium]|nr:FeoA family protein [Actinomycetota bacterium]